MTGIVNSDGRAGYELEPPTSRRQQQLHLLAAEIEQLNDTIELCEQSLDYLKDALAEKEYQQNGLIDYADPRHQTRRI